MAVIIGDPTQDANFGGLTSTRVAVNKFTLAQNATLQEMHGWFRETAGGAGAIKFVVYAADGGAGEPGTLLGVSAEVVVPAGTASLELFTTLALDLTAGDYWIGSISNTDFGQISRAPTGGTYRNRDGVTYASPPNPFGAGTSQTFRQVYWGVGVTTGGAAGSDGRHPAAFRTWGYL